ncbi:MAG: hypothetical protein V3U78_07235 [Thiotrichaceae bacterium]
MSTKLYILLSGIIVSITMVGLFVATSKLQENKSTHQLANQSDQSVKIARTSTANQKKGKGVESETNQSLTILNMWYDLESSADTGSIRIDSDIKNSRKIGIHSDLLSAIKPGYKVQLPSLVGDNYFLKLGKVEKVTDKEIQIYGELDHNDETYFSTISIIDNTLLAVLSTPSGDYDLRMVDGKGVIYQAEEDAPSKASSVSDLDSFLD